jgi:hypothetical protein
MAQRLPSSRPALASIQAPVHMAPTVTPERWSCRSQEFSAFDSYFSTNTPEQTKNMSGRSPEWKRRFSSSSVPSTSTLTPLEASPCEPVSVTRRHW